MAELYVTWGTKRIKTPPWIFQHSVLPYYLRVVTKIPEHRQLLLLHPDATTPVDPLKYCSWSPNVPIYLTELKDSDVDSSYHFVDKNFATSDRIKDLVTQYLKSVTDVIEDSISSHQTGKGESAAQEVNQQKKTNVEKNQTQDVLHRETQVETGDFPCGTDLRSSLRRTSATTLNIQNNGAALSSLKGNQMADDEECNSTELLKEVRELRYSMLKVEKAQRQAKDLFVFVFFVLWLVCVLMMLSMMLSNSSVKSLEMSLRSTIMSNPVTGCPVSAVFSSDGGPSEQSILKTRDTGHDSTAVPDAAPTVDTEEEKQAQNGGNIRDDKSEDAGGSGNDSSEKIQPWYFVDTNLPIKKVLQFLRFSVKIVTKRAAVIMEEISSSV